MMIMMMMMIVIDNGDDGDADYNADRDGRDVAAFVLEALKKRCKIKYSLIFASSA